MDNKYNSIAMHIRNEIISLALDGSRLPSIRELSLHFNVTAITMRKAIKLLEKEGLVKVRGQSGTYLTKKACQEKNFLNFGFIGYDIFTREHSYLNAILRGFSAHIAGNSIGCVQFLMLPLGEKMRRAAVQRICEMVKKGFLDALAISIPLASEELRMLRDTGVPIVFVNRRTPEKCSYVMENPARMAELMTLAAGEKKIAHPAVLGMVEIPDNTKIGTDSVRQLAAHLEKAGIRTSGVFRMPTEEQLPGLGMAFLRETFRKAPETDCIFAFGDMLITEAKQFISSAKRKITLIAYSDEHPVDGAVTFAPPLQKIGQLAAEALEKQSRDKSMKATEIMLEPIQYE